MAELRPYPFGPLVTRMFDEFEQHRKIFDLPERRFFLGDPTLDLSVRFHGQRASTPLGPAAGPQSQMAQNMVLSWLGGCRILELKTVQVDDRLRIPRPCIDMQTVGYNIEWSQELRLEESLEEYVKGAMLIQILVASGALEIPPGFEHTLYDMSVGYDLAGIQSAGVLAFLDGMQDCRAIVDRLRDELPPAHRRYRDLDFAPRISDTLTLSTFHGCPPGEIEAIVEFLLQERGLHSIVKLNPMLLGPDDTRAILADVLGFRHLTVPDTAFERDTRWSDMVGFVDRLGELAARTGLGFGVKFTNTLIVENHRDFFPATEREMYLSGPPLHVLAMVLVDRFRREFRGRYPISFSAGIDRHNFADAVAMGLVPVTTCSDLLKPGGYGRARGYFDELRRRMDAVGARSLQQFTLLAHGAGQGALAALDLPADSPLARVCCDWLASPEGPFPDLSSEQLGSWLTAAELLNTERHVAALPTDSRYHATANQKLPAKIGSALELFDCITCDKCVPVCPNDANFTLDLPTGDLPVVKLRWSDGRWIRHTEGQLSITQRHQLANFADFCNDCGNCDVFCPEDGGPYLIKPRFFGSLSDWQESRALDGFHVQNRGAFGRFQGREYAVTRSGETTEYRGPGFKLTFADHDLDSNPVTGSPVDEVDLTYARLLLLLREAILEGASANYLRYL